MMIKKLSNYNQQAFTLVELIVSLAIGLVLFAGVMTIFTTMKVTSKSTSSYGELQENGRFALNLLSEDLMRQNFWGDYTGVFRQDKIQLAPGLPAVGNECAGDGLNNGTFPNGSDNHFRTLWGDTVDNANQLGCVNNANLDSDIIQIKHVITRPLLNPPGNANFTPITNAPAGNFHIVTNVSEGIIFQSGAVPAISNSSVWQYQHHVYYVRNDAVGNRNVPVLMMGQLTNNMVFSPVVDGIEMIRFMYGVDLTTNPEDPGYGSVDTFISADNMTPRLWDNEGGVRILAVKIYVLARNIEPDLQYDNTNTYQLGDLAFTPDDNYRRLLFSSTVPLFNAGVDSW